MLRVIILAASMYILLFACSPKIAPVEKPAWLEAPAQENSAKAKATWEVEWDRTLKAARTEGKVEVYDGGATALGLKASIEIVKNKFGIDLLITSGRASEITAKVRTQRANGLYLVDVMPAGPGGMVSDLKPAGALDPLRPVLLLPEVVDGKNWHEGEINWADTEKRYVLNYARYPNHSIVTINKELVRPGEIQSYYDLLDPKWKGKIIINDPTLSGGSGFSGFSSLLHNKAVDLDFFRQLVANKPVMITDQDLQLTWLARGKYPVLFMPSTGRISNYIEAGAPITGVEDIKEGTYLGSGGSGLALINKAPHPNAARVYINWFLSKEGQAIFQKYVSKQTGRVDVPPEGLVSFMVRRPGAKYFPRPDDYEDWILKERKRYEGLAEEIFIPLKQ